MYNHPYPVLTTFLFKEIQAEKNLSKPKMKKINILLSRLHYAWK